MARGSLSRECLLGGEWSGSEPSCDFVDCGDPEQLLNGKYEALDGRTTYDAEVAYTCTDDYNVVGETKIRCAANGRWTRARTRCEIIKCRPPRQPSGGRVSGYNYEVHRKVEYSCMPGHLLKGDPVLQCLRTGEWNSEPPRCRYIDCQKIRKGNLEGGSINYVNGTTHLGSAVTFSCDKSYSLTGVKEVVCEDTGRWSGSPPTCSEIRCVLPPKPNNTIVSISSGSSIERLHGTTVIRDRLTSSDYPVGSQLKYRCERGHVLEGGKRVTNRVCTKSGEWTGNEPSCTHVDCLMPDLVDNGEFRLQNNATAYGSMVFYECAVGWKLEGRAAMKTDVCVFIPSPQRRDQPFWGIRGVQFFLFVLKPARRLYADTKLKNVNTKYLNARRKPNLKFLKFSIYESNLITMAKDGQSFHGQR